VDTESLKEQVVSLLNQERAAQDLPPLRRVRTLEQAAQSYAEAMMRATAGGPVYLAHLGPDGSTLVQRVNAAGYRWFSLGETLAAGQKSAEQVIAEWFSSPLHRQNLMSREYRDVGIGITVGPGTWSDGRYDSTVIWWAINVGVGPDSAPEEGPATAPSTPSPPPVVTGYTGLDGAPLIGAAFGSLVRVNGRNFGLSGAVSFHGRPAGIVTWSPTSLLVLVPLQDAYPDAGPVTVTVGGQTGTGPAFSTVRPGTLVQSPQLPPQQPNPVGTPDSGAPAAKPAISDLVNGGNERVVTVKPGQLVTLRGRGFGTNSGRKGRVQFISTNGVKLDAGIWSWSDDAITVFTPFLRGAFAVVVQVDPSHSSNRVSVTIQ
jgi:hypothetical protein